MTVGKLDVICGPMWSGKSSEMLRRLRRKLTIKKKCILITPEKDIRYGKTTLCTHNLESPKDDANLKKLIFSRDKDINSFEVDKDVDSIFIDEGQFLDNLLIPLCDKFIKLGVNITISTLDMTSKREPWSPEISHLLSICNNTVKLQALCYNCGKKASYSECFTNETEKEVIGGADKYRACCGDCFGKG